ncbi:MAG: MFS transporter [Azospirillaceae bacterium]|nr:MFS transporter [Azospirillaceae bacterium]
MASALTPLSPNLGALLALQFIAGLGSGTFVPLAIGFVMRSLKPAWQVFGLAAYAMSLELSQNLPASLEGFYVDHWGWQWIYWQHLFLVPPLLVLVILGMPRDPPNRDQISRVDAPGLAYLGIGASLAYTALDQGDRLDWFGSGLVVALAAGAAFLLVMFVVRELTAERPFFDFHFASSSTMLALAFILALYRFQTLATAFIIPQFLTQVQGYRALDVGDALLWVAAPQFLLAPLVGLVLQRLDARGVMAIGFTAIAGACLMVANGLTHEWISADFIPSQLLQATGQCLGFTAFLFYVTRHIVPSQVLTFGVFIHTFRLLGGEMGTSLMTWFIRMREQTHSNLLGLHVTAGGSGVQDHLAAVAGGLAAQSPGNAAMRAVALLAQSVQKQAYVLAFIDAMTVVAGAAALCLVLVATLKFTSCAIPPASTATGMTARP